MTGDKFKGQYVRNGDKVNNQNVIKNKVSIQKCVDRTFSWLISDNDGSYLKFFPISCPFMTKQEPYRIT